MTRPLAIAAAAIAFGSALWHAPEAFDDVHGEIAALEGRGDDERLLAPARGVDLDTRILVEARRLVPEDATYAVVSGDGVELSTSTTLAALAPFAGYWLLPRRQVREPGQAEWVLSYGGDLDALGLAFARRVEVAEGLTIAEVARG